MPELPTVQLRGQAPRMKPVQIQPGSGAAIGQGLDQLGEVALRLTDASDKAETARIVAETRAQFSAAISEESLSKSDYNEFRDSATARLGELHQQALDNPNARVKSLVRNALQDDFIRSQTLIRQETFRKQKDKVGADYLTTMDQLAKSSVGADEATQRQNAIDFTVLQAELVADGFLTREQAFKDRKRFSDDIILHTANQMIDDGQADQVLRDASAGKFNTVDPEARRKLTNDARTALERYDKANEKAAGQVKSLVMNGWQAAANRGQLQTRFGNELQEALDGKNPYITAKEARTLLEVDNNPATGEGKESVEAIAAEYYLKPRSLGAINSTRRQLAALQRQLGKASPDINKFANELQSDQTTLENQGIAREANEIARENREIKEIKTDYDATKQDLPPAFQRLLGNHDAQNRARIEMEYRKNGPEAARKLAAELAKGLKSKTDAIPQRNKAVIDLAPGG